MPKTSKLLDDLDEDLALVFATKESEAKDRQAAIDEFLGVAQTARLRDLVQP